jgi:hypothetical protein
MRLLTVCLSAVLLAACAAPSAHWEKSGASQTAVNEALQECRVQARLSPEPRVRRPDPALPGALPEQQESRDAREAQALQRCMQEKGYSARR